MLLRPQYEFKEKEWNWEPKHFFDFWAAGFLFIFSSCLIRVPKGNVGVTSVFPPKAKDS